LRECAFGTRCRCSRYSRHSGRFVSGRSGKEAPAPDDQHADDKAPNDSHAQLGARQLRQEVAYVHSTLLAVGIRVSRRRADKREMRPARTTDRPHSLELAAINCGRRAPRVRLPCPWSNGSSDCSWFRPKWCSMDTSSPIGWSSNRVDSSSSSMGSSSNRVDSSFGSSLDRWYRKHSSSSWPHPGHPRCRSWNLALSCSCRLASCSTRTTSPSVPKRSRLS